jgi:hypothetical protein
MMNTPDERETFLQLIQENKGILFKICHSYCRNRSDREDLAIGVFIGCTDVADFVGAATILGHLFCE